VQSQNRPNESQKQISEETETNTNNSLNDHCRTGEKEIVAKGFRNYNNNAIPIYRREDQLQEEKEENKNRLKYIFKKLINYFFKKTNKQTKP
jgi:hypothetical protein